MCDCPHPELCRLMGPGVPGGHFVERVLEIWSGVAPPADPLDPTLAAKFRTAWLARAGITMADVPEALRPAVSLPVVKAAPPVLRTPAVRPGDHVHHALAAVGVTPERVEAVLGSCGGCPARRKALNDLDRKAREGVAAFGAWISGFLGGK